MDRRRHERYDLESPLTFSWKEAGGARHRQRGLLRNMSGGGVFVRTNQSPPEGTRVQFRMSFRSFFADSRLVLWACAEVLRVESAPALETDSGFAAAIKTFTLRNAERRLIERGTAGEGARTASSVRIKLAK